MRRYREFAWKEARYRICSPAHRGIVSEIKRQRALLERYIRSHPAFGSSLSPVEARPDAPPIAKRMAKAANAVGVGPMAAVAGAMAETAARAALASDAREAIVENGGDIYLASAERIIVGLYAGRRNPVADKLSLAVQPQQMPLAICSSSSRMGHSFSLGRCDLATVIAKDAALADAAATQAGNLVRDAGDIGRALQRIMAIDGVQGLLIVKDEKVGIAGEVPRLVRNRP